MMLMRVVISAVLTVAAASAAFGAVDFAPQPAGPVGVYDYLEVRVVSTTAPGNPFAQFALTGELLTPSGQRLPVDGFCDSADGKIHRIRFLATAAGNYRYTVRFDNGIERAERTGVFTARAAPGARGLLRVDAEHPTHFVWSGTGEHYFWNGLTTYALLGWKDDGYIGEIIDRAARLKVNRLRVTLVGPRVADASRWYEPVKPSDRFQFLYGPWPAKDPLNIHEPGWVTERFNVELFQKAERALKRARAVDVILSIVFFLDGEDAGADPFGKARMFSPEEKSYYRYVNARLGAFSNVTWDVTNEWHLFRNAWWVERMGSYLKSIDPYGHLISTHGRGDFPWAISQWPDFALYQIWDEAGGYEAMLQRRQAQVKTGHPIPQVNEEYGYEDTYPEAWGGNLRPPARNADSRRRLAWQIAMAGCYQTTGEKASRNGDGKPPATPGGWVNGGFDDSMHMLEGYQRMVEFFRGIPYWRLEPVPVAVAGRPGDGSPLVLAEAGEQYVVYLKQGGGGQGSVPVQAGRYTVRRFDPVDGVWTPEGILEGKTAFAIPATRADRDVVFLLQRATGPVRR